MVIAITTEEGVAAGATVEVVSAAFGIDEIVSITAVKALEVLSNSRVIWASRILIVAANECVIAGSS